MFIQTTTTTNRNQKYFATNLIKLERKNFLFLIMLSLRHRATSSPKARTRRQRDVLRCDELGRAFACAVSQYVPHVAENVVHQQDGRMYV